MSVVIFLEGQVCGEMGEGKCPTVTWPRLLHRQQLTKSSRAAAEL